MYHDIFKITIRNQVLGGWPVFVENKSNNACILTGIQSFLRIDLVMLRELTLDSRAYGIFLGQALFRDAVLEFFIAALSRVHERLYIRLVIEDVMLRQEVLWGRLCVPIDGIWSYLHLTPRLAGAQLIISRSTRNFPSLSTNNLSALIVAANPVNLSYYHLTPFNAPMLAARIVSVLSGHKTRQAVSGGTTIPSLNTICDCLSESPCSLLHIICHGRFKKDDGESVLFLENHDGSGQTEVVTATRFIERLSQVVNLPYLIFLESCESAMFNGMSVAASFAQRLIEDLGIPTVIAMSDRISIQSADQLAVATYRKLLIHGEPDRALNEALTTITDQPDVLVPVLMTRLEAATLFTPSPIRDLPIKTDSRSIRKILIAAFNIDEIETLCIEVMAALRDAERPLPISLEQIGGTSKDTRVLRIVAEIERYGALPFLIAAMQRIKPGIINL
ncbi:hypothetical protein OSCT_1499 [Oscillochloris trichoides DG-6]|uniref:CHAT domain-containing protein n=1 Tax=Oscillochloris trichoides DG-6 TaxID=765420 RepID=E1IDU8_9CHLR|nr:hypothetical protein OSCT_1499 [Oscillochloris trichoides DG-6]